jgi:hypothetical protein
MPTINKQVNISMPESLHALLGAYAKQNNLSISEAARRGVSLMLEIEPPVVKHGGNRYGAGCKSKPEPIVENC